MYNEIFVAGSGGQGILSLGRIIVTAAVQENKYATYYPSYGAEIRGGTANCMLKISDTKIYSPIIENPSEMIIMNTPSYLKFITKYNPQSYLFLNMSLVEKNDVVEEYILKKLKNLNVVEVFATEIADKIGNILVANMVMLGAMIKKIGLLKIDTIKNILGKKYDSKVISLNIKAIEKGFDETK